MSDATSDNMEIVSGGPIGVLLADPIQVGMTADSLGTVALYQGQLRGATGYSDTGTFSIPLYASQTVVGTDAAGTYQITLIYIAMPGT